MKLSRLWRPRHPLFWLMVLFNLLSSACSWALRSLPLTEAAMWLIAAAALGNMGFGLWCAWRLVRLPEPD